MSATQSDVRPPPDHDPLFTEGGAPPIGRIRRKRFRSNRTATGGVGSSSSTTAAVQHATAAAAHATEKSHAAGDETSSGAQDSNRRPKGESYTVGLLREWLQKEELRLRLMDNKTRFILAVILGEMCIGGRSKADIVAELEYACYDKMPIYEDGLEENFNSQANSAQQGVKEGAISYDYLLEMPISWLTLEKLQELQEAAEFQTERVTRARAALAPELSEPEVLAALAECHDECHARRPHSRSAGLGGGMGVCNSMTTVASDFGHQGDEGKAEEGKGMMDAGDYEDQLLPGVQKAQEGLSAAAELEEEESPPWTGPPPELLVMSPCCLQRWGKGWLLPLRTGALLRDDQVQVLLTSAVVPKAIVHEDSLDTLMQLVTAAPVHRPSSIYTQPPASPQPGWQDDVPGPVPMPGPPLQPGPTHHPQQQSAQFGAPFWPLPPPPHWPPQPPRPFMAGTAAPVPRPPQRPGPFTAGTRGFVPPPRPPPYEPPRPPLYAMPRIPPHAPPRPPPHHLPPPG
ncbi:probable DNA topoisomerase 2 at N-terminal half [Coccomyxa sp. Obi]|nr:probable DNA topoisomerase 2 at N-terminal half [Coccomyxa sp. Obi]